MSEPALEIPVGTRKPCRHCGEEIIYEPYYLDGLPNPPVWAHTSGARTCGTRPKGWRGTWLTAEPEHEEKPMNDAPNLFGMVVAFDSSVPCNVIEFRQPPPDITILGEDGAPLVTIHPNGELEYGPGYEPDEAARRFWDAIRHLAPARCPNCGHVGMEAT